MDLRQRRRGTRRRGCDHPSADPTDRGPGRRSAVRRGLPGERSDGGRLAPSQRGATSHRVRTASAAGAARLVGAQGGRRGGPPRGGKYVHATHAGPIAGAAEDAATRLASAHGSATAASVPAVAGESAAGAKGGR